MADKIKSAPDGAFSLEIVKGPDTGKSFNLKANQEYTVGRSEDCKICVASDKMISRKHVLLKVKAGTNNIALENLSKTNPVQVKGKPVTGTVLKPGDKFQLGGTVFVLKAPAGAATGSSDKPDKKLLLLAGIIVLILLLIIVIFSGGKDTPVSPASVTRSGSDFQDLATKTPGRDSASSLPDISGLMVSDKDMQIADEHFRQGLFFYDTGNILKAVGEWELAISYNPDHADARLWFLRSERELEEKVKNHYQSAMMHYKYMRYKEAAYEFKMVVEFSRDKNSDQYINALRYSDELRNR